MKDFAVGFVKALRSLVNRMKTTASSIEFNVRARGLASGLGSTQESLFTAEIVRLACHKNVLYSSVQLRPAGLVFDFNINSIQVFKV